MNPGCEVDIRIRSDVRTRDLKVLVLTAHAQEETREEPNQLSLIQVVHGLAFRLKSHPVVLHFYLSILLNGPM